MKTVHINASNEYDVIIGNRLLKEVGLFAADKFLPSKAVIIAGKNTFLLYGKTVINSLKESGFETFSFVHETGENAKSIKVYSEILNFLSKNNFSKTDIIISLGGGVTGDLAGFVAATYLRGIKYIQIPTTLLAQVDASVGGKTALNLESGKNLIGAIYQPSLVICDADSLSTLPQNELNCGLAEVIKYSIIADKELFNSLKNKGFNDNAEEIIFKCVNIKKNFVEKDEFDNGLRQILNLGHTVGHAVEKASNHTFLHGQAVAIGISAISKYAYDKGYLDLSDKNEIISLFEKYNLPEISRIDAKKLLEAALNDKKIRNGKINLIIPKMIGECEIISSEISELQKVIYYG